VLAARIAASFSTSTASAGVVPVFFGDGDAGLGFLGGCA